MISTLELLLPPLELGQESCEEESWPLLFMLGKIGALIESIILIDDDDSLDRDWDSNIFLTVTPLIVSPSMVVVEEEFVALDEDDEDELVTKDSDLETVAWINLLLSFNIWAGRMGLFGGTGGGVPRGEPEDDPDDDPEDNLLISGAFVTVIGVERTGSMDFDDVKIWDSAVDLNCDWYTGTPIASGNFDGGSEDGNGGDSSSATAAATCFDALDELGTAAMEPVDIEFGTE